MIDLTKNEQILKKTAQRAKENNIIIPTFAEMKDPSLIPAKIKDRLKNVGLWDIDPVNLFRVSWKNEPKMEGGLYNDVPNYVELPKAITGVDARILAMSGKYFPTGAHKVGPSLGCLVPRLVTGQFDPTYHAAVWPSTGNYCRGGAFNSKLLACESIAILPEDMSQERFEWLQKVAGEVIATPGGESDVKNIYDKTWELIDTRDNVIIFNQFAEMGNPAWHYAVTGSALESMIKDAMRPGDRVAGTCVTSGSGGTISGAEYVKDAFPGAKVAVGEALQCPTLLNNGFGYHRIEGIGDKHIPWVHNVKNTDMVMAIDDNDALALIRFFNEEGGKEYMRKNGVSEDVIEKLSWIGISGAANILMAIKFAKYYDLKSTDIVATVLTDSMEMYQSRLAEMKEARGGREYDATDAAVDYARSLMAAKTDNMLELGYKEAFRIHNLKYYTWVEQQGKVVEELDQQWYEADSYWGEVHGLGEKLDVLIKEFNDMVGLL
mgnify:CR=1 FL=1